MGSSPRMGGIPSNRLKVDDTESYSTPVLAFNTARQPSTVRPTFIIASVRIDTSQGEEGTVALQTSPDNVVAYTQRGIVRSFGQAAGLLGATVAVHSGHTISFIIPRGQYYKLISANVSGTPTFSIVEISELLL